MRALLDTNILIHREARTVVRPDIGTLFEWLDRLGYKKCIHRASLGELRKHADSEVTRTLRIKLGSYPVLKTVAPDTPEIAAMRNSDRTENDRVDTSLLAELVAGRVEVLITEDRGIHTKAAQLGVSHAVFTIDDFLEKVTAENPDLADYRVLSVRKMLFGEIRLESSFFDSFREDYPGFDRWFNRKADETAYVCLDDSGDLVAFLYVKREGPAENYADVSPAFTRARRLKIGTFKVVANGFKLGERFLKIVFDNALQYGVDEIYVTIFRRTAEQDRLYRLLEDWGFRVHGQKESAGGPETVLVRDFRRAFDRSDPRLTYPYVSVRSRKFIVPIKPEYHTELLPDSILRTESPTDFVENRPNRNAISKVYVSRSIERRLKRGDLIVFYRTRSGSAPAYHTAVATTLGVVQDVVDGLRDKESFLRACRKRSVFTDAQLAEHWDHSDGWRPFVVSFLYIHSFKKRPNLRALKNAGVIATAPRGFERLSDTAFATLLQLAQVNESLVVDQA